MDRPIYKVVSRQLWDAAESEGVFRGAEIDFADGFIHLSSAEQVSETVRLHFAGQDNLVLIGVDPNLLGDSLRWEESRGGDLFPHLYGELPLSAVRSVAPLPLVDGEHQFPPGVLK